MADKTLYAWSPIDAGDKKLKVGDEVTASALGIDKEGLEDLVDSGAVRAKKPPKLPDGWQGSMVDFLRQEAREAELAAGASIDDANLESFQAIGELG
jgi:hypothetical protein